MKKLAIFAIVVGVVALYWYLIGAFFCHVNTPFGAVSEYGWPEGCVMEPGK